MDADFYVFMQPALFTVVGDRTLSVKSKLEALIGVWARNKANIPKTEHNRLT
jgi:hypothetical protein